MQTILRRLSRGLLHATLLLASGVVLASPTGYSVRSDVDGKLYSIDMATGVATEIGATGFSKIEGLAMNDAGELYGVNPPTAQLVKCSVTTGACTAVGRLAGLPAVQANAGLSFTTNGALYLAMNAVIYRVDSASGGVLSLGVTGPALSGLAGVTPSATCASGLFGMGGNTDKGKFFCINTTTGAATLLGNLSLSPLDVGLDGDPATGLVWGVSNNDPGQVFAITPGTLAISNVNTVTVAGKAIGGFESLAISRTSPAEVVPTEGQPVTVPTVSPWMLALLSMMLAGLAALRPSMLASLARK